MRAELANGQVLNFPDEMPDEVMDTEVRKHLAMLEHTAALNRNTDAMNNLAVKLADMAAAYREPRDITVKRDFKGEKVTGAISIVSDAKGKA